MTASMDFTAIVWDLAAQGRATAPTHTGKVLGITVSPDGSTAASLGVDGLALVWDCATGTLQASLQVGPAPRRSAGCQNQAKGCGVRYLPSRLACGRLGLRSMNCELQ